MELSVDIKKKLSGFTLNVKLDAGRKTLGLLGASGSGKSMTLRCIAGIEKPDEGRILLNGRELFHSEKGIHLPCRERRVGYLFQSYALFPNMTVEENIGFGLGRMPKEKRKALVKHKIEIMKLQGLEKRYPAQLSGGQQQRVALARALAIEPEILLLDEPFSALDEHLRHLMAKQLMDTLTDYPGVTLFVTHNMEEAYRICRDLVVLQNGRVEAKGDKEDIFQRPLTLATAQITGCKNFSAAGYVSENRLDALDWGLRLEVKERLTDRVKYVGIRAHYIRQALPDDQTNIFDCWPDFISETPFRVTVYLSFGRHASRKEKNLLQWEVTKEKWAELKEQPLPWKVCLAPEKLLTFEQ